MKRAATKRNFLGFGKKTTHSPKLMQDAFDAGKRSGDTVQFKAWIAKQSSDIHGSFKRRLEKRYRAGVESLWHEEAKVAAKKEVEHKTDIVAEVTDGLVGQGMKKTEAKAKAKAAYKAGDSFDDVWRKVLKKNPHAYRRMMVSDITKYVGTYRDGAVSITRKTLAQIRPYQRKYGGEIIEVIDSVGKHVAYELVVKRAANPAKFDRCVEDVKKSLKKYKRPGNAYAICSAAGTRNPSGRLIDAFSTHSAAQTIAKKYPGAKVVKRHGKFEVWAKAKRRRNYESIVWSAKQGNASAEVYKTSKGYEVEFSNGTVMHAQSLDGARSIARVKLHELASNPNDTFVGEVVPGASQVGALVSAGHRVYRGVRKSAAGLLKRVQGKKNPIDQALKVYEDFHGMPSQEILEITEQEHHHSVKVGIGLLVSLKVLLATKVNRSADLNSPGFEWHSGDGGYWTFDEATPLIKRVLLTSSEDGRQLFLDGGDQSIPDAVLKEWGFSERDQHDHMELGEIVEVTYRTTKAFDKGEVVDYFHAFGKEGSQGVLPTLLYYPRSKKLKIAGGRYYIAPPDKSLGNASPGLVG